MFTCIQFISLLRGFLSAKCIQLICVLAYACLHMPLTFIDTLCVCVFVLTCDGDYAAAKSHAMEGLGLRQLPCPSISNELGRAPEDPLVPD